MQSDNHQLSEASCCLPSGQRRGKVNKEGEEMCIIIPTNAHASSAKLTFYT